MGWAVGYDDNWKRDIGYGVPATCDHPGCGERIDRGLGWVCGFQEPYGGDRGCGLFFCASHGGGLLCERCKPSRKRGEPFTPTPDLQEWIDHKATDPSWAKWREENAVTVTNSSEGK